MCILHEYIAGTYDNGWLLLVTSYLGTYQSLSHVMCWLTVITSKNIMDLNHNSSITDVADHFRDPGDGDTAVNIIRYILSV